MLRRFVLVGLGSVLLLGGAGVSAAQASPEASAPTDVVATTVVDDATYAKIRAAAVDRPGESDSGLLRVRRAAVRPAAGSPPNSTLPYDSTYEVGFAFDSENTWMSKTTGKACVYIRSSRDGVYVRVMVRTEGGSTVGTAVRFPQDGVTRQACFTGLNKAYVYHLRFEKPDYQDYKAVGAATVTS